MKENEKYVELILALGELIHKKNDDLYWKEYEIKQLKEKLEAAEQQIIRKEGDK